jgi:N-acetyl-1-D-myo-inositol-2-amino-2-deoxy-alpha-D-glucopyranoside deacetylase
MGGMTTQPGRPRRRLLLVHAHPDDETLATGATMAKYTAEGAHVTLLTCTRGEEGLVLVPELAHLAAAGEGGLGEYRERELAAAMDALGVRDHRFLDTVHLPSDDGRPAPHYRDSGMAWDAGHRAVAAPDTGDDAFARADVDEAGARVAAVVRELRPHVLVTYEPGGGYGHPDHVQAHRAAMRGVELALVGAGPGGAAWTVPKVYWSVLPESVIRSALREAAQRGELPPGWDPDGELPSTVVPDDKVTAVIDGRAFLAQKTAALRAHATQVIVRDGVVDVGDGARQPIVGVEWYQLASGPVAPSSSGQESGGQEPGGQETDLFVGLDTLD